MLLLVFVTFALAGSHTISQYIAFHVIHSSIQEAKAIKHKTSFFVHPSNKDSTAPSVPSSIQEAKAIKHKTSFFVHPSNKDSTAPSSQSNNAASACIRYSQSTRTITVSCGSARFTDIDNKLKDTNVLAKQSPDGTWFLSANMVIAKGATFSIDSTDTKWLKISSEQTITTTRRAIATSPTPVLPYNIDVHGSLKINSVKITSWDPTTNNYAITNGSREAVPPGTKGATANGYIIHFGAPRGFIKIEHDATGTTDISNSEIAYLGYESGSTSDIGSGGLNYYGADGSVIRDNNIHDLYFGFYSSGLGHLIIENNQIYNNANYGLDPHTGTHDMIIRHNIVHDNGAQGIICSLNCYNVLIENNQIYNNGKAGIMFSRNMSNSVARNNIIYNEVNGILVSQSNYNRIYNNTISDSQYGINVVFGSSGNTFYSNVIKNSSHYGIDSQDPTSNNSKNTFHNNQLINSHSAIRLHNTKPSLDIAKRR
ncbi:MAG: right-handed parallel beta-helix repeat-containing protein [Candidatus Nitrosopolaris sp.]